MRIGIDVKTLSRRYTGIAIYVAEMLRYFSELDTEDEFFLYSHRDFELDFPLGPNFHKRIFRAVTGSFGIMFQLNKQLERDGIDLFWGTEHFIVHGRQQFKQVVTFHDLAVFHNAKLGTRYGAFLQRFIVIPLLKYADKVIAISKSTANDVIESSGIDKGKVKVIYNGDSPYTDIERTYTKEEEKREEEKYGIRPREYLLFVSTIEPRKNIISIVKAYDIYRAKGGKQKLVLAGGLGWRYKPILKSIEESIYKKDIVLTGYVSAEDKEYLYRNATSLVYPSLWEGLGLPIVEAMSVGIPVITSRISSMPELGGDVAYYIDDCYDIRSLACLMTKVDKLTEQERELISAKSKERAALFSRRKCAKEILNLFHSL